MISPDLNTFEQLARDYGLVPLYAEIPGDLNTPVSAFLKIDDQRSSFLLESVEGGERWARYSFIGSDPRLTVKIREDRVELSDGRSVRTEPKKSSVTQTLQDILGDYKAPSLPELPEFFGGAVGYCSYDVVRDFETLPLLNKPDPGFHDFCFMLTRDLIVFDNISHRIILITTVAPREFASVKQAYVDGQFRLEALKTKLEGPLPELGAEEKTRLADFVPNMGSSDYENIVKTAQKHITAGDIIQVVLSQRFQGTLKCDPLNVYRSLRVINPSPYMFFIRNDDEVLAGSSPEVMVRLRNGEAVVRPIAGTRPRGNNPQHDSDLALELLNDTKEIAEHVMLVDLARNDLGRIATPGTVQVDAFKTIERYSHVMHMVSNVKALPQNGFNAFDVLAATFPAGTLTGAPKIRAMEIIEDLEPEHRGPYGGCVGYFSYSGNMDMGITIRTVMMKGSDAYYQAGAGIVADSVPEREHQECVKKSEAMKRALTMAYQFRGRRQ
jgi:anthranilate synthase component I